MASSSRGGDTEKGAARKPRIPREWGDESDILPHHMKVNALTEDDDNGSSLREKPSSSTIKSWYDKTKLPLAVSQQTSASAMAKGPPTKAQKLLDMDNLHATKKKKPNMLDFSLLRPSSRTNTDWERTVLGNDYVTRSPSILSPFMSSPRRLKKRATKESLKSVQVEPVKPRPGTGGDVANPRHPPPHMSDLPDLYKHYEQMSFAQILEENEEKPKEPAKEEAGTEKLPEPSISFSTVPDPYATYRVGSEGSRHDDPLKSHPSQTLYTLTPKIEQPSPSYAATISSRHTQTSKASRHTSKSFPVADLQEKSVLMLSSDSESDDDVQSHSSAPIQTRKPAAPSPPTRRQSKPEFLLNPSYGTSLSAPSLAEDYDPRTSQTFKRVSTAPAGFITIPTGQANQTPSPTPSPANSRASSHWGTTFHAPASPSSGSSSLKSSAPSMTWQSVPEYGVYEARAVTMFSAQGPVDRDSSEDSDLEYEQPEAVIRRGSLAATPSRKSTATVSSKASTKQAPSTRASMVTTSSRASLQALSINAQPTPPLSPASVDFYMQQSAPEPVNSPVSPQEHLMGLTRQEQLLITALRQRREDMKRASFGSGDRPNLQRSPKGHQSNPSETTITEANFNFGFPQPPKSEQGLPPSLSNASSMSELLIPGGKGDDEKSCTADGTVFVLSPPPSSHHKFQNSLHKSQSYREPRRPSQDDQMLLYLDHAGGTALPISGGIMSSETLSFKAPITRDSFTQVRRQRSNIETSSRSIKRDRIAARNRKAECPIYEEEPSMPPPKQRLPSPPRQKSTYHPPQKITEAAEQLAEAEATAAAEVARPDSPISPMTEAFPEVPKKRQTLTSARLSAFGPPPLFNAGWWGDED